MFIKQSEMKKRYFLPCLVIVFLSGCEVTMPTEVTQSSDKSMISNSSKGQVVNKSKTESGISHLVQCNRDLEALHTVNTTEYHRYIAEYDGLMKSSAGFMTVKDDVSPEVAELARPRFQFALVNLCYRIKDALAQTLINQAGGH